MKRIFLADTHCLLALSLLAYVALGTKAYAQEDRSTWSEARWKAHYQINDELCSNALNADKSDWNANPDRAAYVAEAKSRDLTVDACLHKSWEMPQGNKVGVQKDGTPSTDDDALQKAFNYLFTGNIDGDPQGIVHVQIIDRNSCTVLSTATLMPSAKVTFYFRNMRPDTITLSDATPPDCAPGFYCPGRMGSPPKLTIEGDDTVSSTTDDKQEIGRSKTTSFNIIGDPERMKRALRYIFSQCSPKSSKLPF